MRKILLYSILLLMLTGCPLRRQVTVAPGTAGPSIAGALIEDTTLALSVEFADLDKILKSDLPAEAKAKLASELINKRAEMMEKTGARKKEHRKDAMTTLHNVGIFISALIFARWGI